MYTHKHTHTHTHLASRSEWTSQAEAPRTKKSSVRNIRTHRVCSHPTLTFTGNTCPTADRFHSTPGSPGNCLGTRYRTSPTLWKAGPPIYKNTQIIKGRVLLLADKKMITTYILIPKQYLYRHSMAWHNALLLTVHKGCGMEKITMHCL